MNKTNQKYVTLSEGNDFRSIAKIMTDAGLVMNHATARNKLMSAMEKLFGHVALEIGGSKNKNEDVKFNIEVLLKDQSVHEYLSEILYLAHNEKENIK